MGNCASSAAPVTRGHVSVGRPGDLDIDNNRTAHLDGGGALGDDADDKSVGKPLYTTGAQRAHSLKLNDKLKLADALVAGGMDRSVRGGALGERSIRADRSYRGGDRSVRGGGAYSGVAGPAKGLDRSVRRGNAYASTPNQPPVSVAATAAAGHGPAVLRVTAAEHPRPVPADSGECEDAYVAVGPPADLTGAVPGSGILACVAPELQRLRHGDSKDVDPVSSLVRLGSSAAGTSGGGATANGGSRTRGNGAPGVRTSGSGAPNGHGSSTVRRGSLGVEVEADTLLALSKGLCTGPPSPSWPRPCHHPQPPQQQSRSPSLGRGLIDADVAVGVAGTARLEGGSDGGSLGVSPKAYRRQNRSMPAPGAAGTADGGLVEDVEEHELPPVDAAAANPGSTNRRGGPRAAPPRSRSTSTLTAQEQQAAGTGGGSPTPTTPQNAAGPCGSPFDAAASAAAAATSSSASGPPHTGVARMQMGVSRSASGGTQAAATAGSGGRRFLTKSRPQVDLAAQPKRPALKGSPLSGAAHSLFGSSSARDDVSMTEVEALPAPPADPADPAALQPWQPPVQPQPQLQQPAAARLGVRPVQPASPGGLLRAGEAMSLPARFSDLKLPTSPGDLEDLEGAQERLEAQQPAAAAALSTSLLGGGAVHPQGGASSAAATAAGRQLQPQASVTRLRVQTNGPAVGLSATMAMEQLPGSPSASAAARAASPSQQPQPQHLVISSPGQTTAPMLGSPSSSALTSSRRETLSPRASSRASSRVHPSPLPAAAAAPAADSPSPSSRLQANSFHRASSNLPCSSPVEAAQLAHHQPLYDSATSTALSAPWVHGGGGGAQPPHAPTGCPPVDNLLGAATVGMGGGRGGAPADLPGGVPDEA